MLLDVCGKVVVGDGGDKFAVGQVTSEEWNSIYQPCGENLCCGPNCEYAQWNDQHFLPLTVIHPTIGNGNCQWYFLKNALYELRFILTLALHLVAAFVLSPATPAPVPESTSPRNPVSGGRDLHCSCNILHPFSPWFPTIQDIFGNRLSSSVRVP